MHLRYSTVEYLEYLEYQHALLHSLYPGYSTLLYMYPQLPSQFDTPYRFLALPCVGVCCGGPAATLLKTQARIFLE
jgi:hypothetical protein